jgi:hypothetical protein
VLFSLEAFSALDAGGVAGYMKNNTLQARSSGGEHYLDTVGVRGSNPRVPTIDFKGLRLKTVTPALFIGSTCRPSGPPPQPFLAGRSPALSIGNQTGWYDGSNYYQPETSAKVSIIILPHQNVA